MSQNWTVGLGNQFLFLKKLAQFYYFRGTFTIQNVSWGSFRFHPSIYIRRIKCILEVTFSLSVRPCFFIPQITKRHAKFTETSIMFTVLMWTTLKLGSIRASFVILLYLGFIPWELWIMRSHKNQEILENIKFRLSGTGSLLRSQMFVQNGMRLEHFKIQENHFLWITLIDWWNF